MYQHLSESKTPDATEEINSYVQETVETPDGKLFDASPETSDDKTERTKLPLYYTFACWVCGAMVSNQDSRCPNCEQDLNNPPF